MKLNWYRVVEATNPLSGCDVLCDEEMFSKSYYCPVYGVRRIDVFVGDRPFQMVSADPSVDMGIAIHAGHMKLSSIQHRSITLSTDRPNGLCILEKEWEDGKRIVRYAEYENGRSQVSVSIDGSTTVEWKGFVKKTPFLSFMLHFDQYTKDEDLLTQIMELKEKV